MVKNINAQFAIEFVVLIAFMFLIFLGFIAVITAKVLEAKENENRKIAEDIAALTKNEVELAITLTDGYQRNFVLPSRIKGSVYSIEIIDNRELVVNYLDQEFVSFLPEKICGDILIPNNEITKENHITCVNSNLDEIQCQNAETWDLCDAVEDLLPGAKCCCWNRYQLCEP